MIYYTEDIGNVADDSNARKTIQWTTIGYITVPHVRKNRGLNSNWSPSITEAISSKILNENELRFKASQAYHIKGFRSAMVSYKRTCQWKGERGAVQKLGASKLPSTKYCSMFSEKEIQEL